MSNIRRKIHHESPRAKSYLFGIVLLSVSTVTVVTAYSGNAPQTDDTLWSQLLPESLQEEQSPSAEESGTKITQGVPEVADPVPLTPLEATEPEAPKNTPPKTQLPPKPESESLGQSQKTVPGLQDSFGSSRVDALNSWSWFQVSATDLEVPRITRTHAYFMDDRQVFRGKISMLGTSQTIPTSITFSQLGRVVREVPLSQNGDFTVQSLPPGPYGLHVNNQDTMMIYGLYLATTNDLRESGYTEDKIE